MKALIVVDMQNDFVNGILGTDKAKEIVPNIVNKITNFDGEVFYTQDTHTEDYSNTLEGKYIPEHCIEGTIGCQIVNEIPATWCNIIEKNTFGYLDWEFLEDYDEIELCGVCTDICVISNALILRTMFPEKRIVVDKSCCAGTNCKAHFSALTVMRSNLIEVV